MKKHGIESVALFLASFSFAFAQAQVSITIPGITNTSNPTGFIGGIYNFSLMAAGLLAFGAIVYGGIKYITAAGNPSGQTEGKEWIRGAIYGLLLLFGAYAILNLINPDITTLALPVPTPIEPLANVPNGGVIPPGGQYPPGQNCQPPPSGPCSASILQANGGSCFGGNLAIAQGICNAESANGQLMRSGSDRCDDGSSASIGLFQINISTNQIAGLDCPAAFSNRQGFTGSHPTCTITNRDLYNRCVNAALDPVNNIQKACQLSGGGVNWSRWGPKTRQACGV